MRHEPHKRYERTRRRLHYAIAGFTLLVIVASLGVVYLAQRML